MVDLSKYKKPSVCGLNVQPAVTQSLLSMKLIHHFPCWCIVRGLQRILETLNGELLLCLPPYTVGVKRFCSLSFPDLVDNQIFLFSVDSQKCLAVGQALIENLFISDNKMAINALWRQFYVLLYMNLCLIANATLQRHEQPCVL